MNNVDAITGLNLRTWSTKIEMPLFTGPRLACGIALLGPCGHSGITRILEVRVHRNNHVTHSGIFLVFPISNHSLLSSLSSFQLKSISSEEPSPVPLTAQTLSHMGGFHFLS